MEIEICRWKFGESLEDWHLQGVMVAALGGGGTELSGFAPEASTSSQLHGHPGAELSLAEARC